MEREQQLPSGIVIPDTAKEKPQEGKVVAVGPGKMDHGQLVKPDVKVGDHVLYKRYGGDEIKDLEGKVGEIDEERGKVKVLVPMFGRETPVELEADQVQRV